MGLKKLVGLPNGKIHFQSHRGAGRDFPENTMAAFIYAWGLEGAIPEVDVRTSADGVMVCIHDNHLRRTTSAPLNIAFKHINNLNYAQIKKVDAGIKFGNKFQGEQIPSLIEVFEELQLIKKRKLYLDVKDLDLNKLKKLVNNYSIEKQIIFVHENIEKCKKIQDLFKDAKTMSWLSGRKRNIINKYNNISNSYYKGLNQLQLHLDSNTTKGKIIYKLSNDFLSSAVEDTIDNGIELMVRPFYFDHCSISSLLKLGIRWFVVDKPGRFLKTLKEIYN